MKKKNFPSKWIRNWKITNVNFKRYLVLPFSPLSSYKKITDFPEIPWLKMFGLEFKRLEFDILGRSFFGNDKDKLTGKIWCNNYEETFGDYLDFLKK